MFNTVAFITAISLFSIQPVVTAADVSAELIWEDHYSQEGVEVNLYVTCYGKGFCVPDDSNVPGGAGGVPGDGGDGDGDGSGSAGDDDD